jgi:hypothetical protein
MKSSRRRDDRRSEKELLRGRKRSARQRPGSAKTSRYKNNRKIGTTGKDAYPNNLTKRCTKI